METLLRKHHRYTFPENSGDNILLKNSKEKISKITFLFLFLTKYNYVVQTFQVNEPTHVFLFKTLEKLYTTFLQYFFPLGIATLSLTIYRFFLLQSFCSFSIFLFQIITFNLKKREYMPYSKLYQIFVRQ